MNNGRRNLFGVVAAMVAAGTSIVHADDYRPLPAVSGAIEVPRNARPAPVEPTDAAEVQSWPSEPVNGVVVRSRTLSRAGDRRFAITTINAVRRAGRLVLNAMK